jgi:serine/threonine-protein kinase
MVGETISHYKVLEKIGEGGMGVVYRATDTKLNRDVALKILPEQFASDSQRMARFQREAEVLASLDHPNIGQIYGIEEAGQTKALVLQLIEGPTLAERIAQGPIPVEEALKIALQVAEGLEAAHEKGVIHRDLKPANIKITPEDQVKILDFGLAKAFEVAGPDSSLTQSPTLTNAATQAGVILGTAAYMSPEQAKGKAVDKRADIFSFGAVLYEMLTGRRTFEGEDVADTLASVLKSDPEWRALSAKTPAVIERLLRRCLTRDVHKRLRDVGEVRITIEEYLEDPSAGIAQPVAEVVQAAAQSKLPWFAATALVSILIAGVAAWNLKPEAPGTVTRFSHVLPEGQRFTGLNRTLVAISPDGSKMAYVANRQLHVRAMDAPDSTSIPGTYELPAAPFFSPDGQWIGYWSRRDAQLKKIAVSGGASVTLSDASTPFGAPVWGTDNMIIWSQIDGIMRVSANGGTPEVLISNPGTIGSPQMLPGGSRLLVTRHFNAPASDEIVVHFLESGEQKVLFAGTSPRYVSTGHIVYAVDDVLFAVPFDLDTLEVVGGAVAMVEGVRLPPAQYAVSDSGSLVFVPGGAARSELTLALVDRNGQVKRLNVPSKEYLSPRISPDGRRVAVQTTGADGSQIWTYDLSGETAIQRLTLESNNYRPIWTPDGERITFASDRDGTTSIYWQAADGSGLPERLTTAEEGTYHWPDSWSPDGNTLVFRMESNAAGAPNNIANEMDIWTVPFDGGVPGEPEVFSARTFPFQESGAAFSPDGRWLAYAGGDATMLDFEIYVEPFPPTGERRLVSRAQGIMPLWSRDGQELFYRTVNQTGDTPQTLRKINVSTKPAFTFTTEETVQIGEFMSFGYYRSFDVTPDGERFLVVLPPQATDSDAPQPQINVVVNWFEELKERVPVP